MIFTYLNLYTVNRQQAKELSIQTCLRPCNE